MPSQVRSSQHLPPRESESTAPPPEAMGTTEGNIRMLFVDNPRRVLIGEGVGGGGPVPGPRPAPSDRDRHLQEGRQDPGLLRILTDILGPEEGVQFLA